MPRIPSEQSGAEAGILRREKICLRSEKAREQGSAIQKMFLLVSHLYSHNNPLDFVMPAQLDWRGSRCNIATQLYDQRISKFPMELTF